MARTAIFSDDGEEQDSSPYNEDISVEDQARVFNSSPAASFSSDKENRPTEAPLTTKSRGMPPPQLSASEGSASRRGVRRKLADRDATQNGTQKLHRQRLEEAGDSEFYDPEQSMAQRRELRREYRDLARDLTGIQALTTRSHWLQNTNYSGRLSS